MCELNCEIDQLEESEPVHWEPDMVIILRISFSFHFIPNTRTVVLILIKVGYHCLHFRLKYIPRRKNKLIKSKLNAFYNLHSVVVRYISTDPDADSSNPIIARNRLHTLVH